MLFEFANNFFKLLNLLFRKLFVFSELLVVFNVIFFILNLEVINYFLYWFCSFPILFLFFTFRLGLISLFWLRFFSCFWLSLLCLFSISFILYLLLCFRFSLRIFLSGFSFFWIFFLINSFFNSDILNNKFVYLFCSWGI